MEMLKKDGFSKYTRLHFISIKHYTKTHTLCGNKDLQTSSKKKKKKEEKIRKICE